jgi:hypothetical protein
MAERERPGLRNACAPSRHSGDSSLSPKLRERHKEGHIGTTNKKKLKLKKKKIEKLVITEKKK